MENLKTLLDELKLRSFSQSIEDILDRYPGSRKEFIEILECLCASEIADRRKKTITYRTEQAKFSQIQTVDTFDFKYNASTLKLKNRYLKLYTPELITQGLSVLFVGASGLGKTHLARALGYFLCQNRLRVRFTTLEGMSLDLKTADFTGTLRKAMLAYTQPALLIID